jgi:hypothetical protein
MWPSKNGPFAVSADTLKLWAAWIETCNNSAITIATRLSLLNMGLLGGRSLPLAELLRMVTEKQQATLASLSAGLAAAPGLPAAMAMLAPYRQTTRQNAARLTRGRR